MLEEFGFEAFEFCYPFPDYKVPDAILSDQYLESARHPEQVLGGISSRDYAGAWEPKLTESLFWQAAAQTGSLDEFANSFLIVAGNSADRVRAAIGFDFVRFASMTRKLPYRLQVSKNTGQTQVQRVAVDRRVRIRSGMRQPQAAETGIDPPDTGTPGAAIRTTCTFTTARGRRGPAVLSASVQVMPGAW